MQSKIDEIISRAECDASAILAEMLCYDPECNDIASAWNKMSEQTRNAIFDNVNSRLKTLVKSTVEECLTCCVLVGADQAPEEFDTHEDGVANCMDEINYVILGNRKMISTKRMYDLK